MKKKFKINEKAVRAALTILYKNNCIKQTGWRNEDFENNKLTLIVNVEDNLVMTKRVAYKISKQEKKKK